MDWPLHNDSGFNFSKSEASHASSSVFHHVQGQSTVVRLLSDEYNSLEVWPELNTRESWKSWFKEHHDSRNSSYKNGLIVVLARRAPSSRDYRQTSISHLPFSAEIFTDLTKKFLIHNHIVRVVSRTDVATFTAAEIQLSTGDPPALVYNCRSSNLWADDLALSATHLPDRGFTYAVIYGCTKEIERKVIGRLRSIASEDATQAAHPMLLAGIFAEIEQKRLATEVTETLMRLAVKVMNLDDGQNSHGQTNGISGLWHDTTHLQCGLESWRAQLGEMIRYLEELSSRWWAPPAEGVPALQRAVQIKQLHLSNEQPSTTLFLGTKQAEKADPHAIMAMLLQLCGTNTDDPSGLNVLKIRERRDRLRTVSAKMLNRLRVMTHELDDGIRNCKQRADGVILSANLEIAKSSGRSGKTMQSLTFISMLFLPFMLTTALFSTQFFNWFPREDQAIVSPYAWVLPLFGSGLLIFGLLVYCGWRAIRKIWRQNENGGYISIA